MEHGRIRLVTDVEEITAANVIDVVRTAYNEYLPSIGRMDFLLGYEAGCQPLLRPKTYRPDISCECTDNLANEITEFKTGYIWGNPITFIQRGEKNEFDNNILSAIAELNRCYESQNIRGKTQELARYVEITGVGYTYVDVNTDYFEDSDSYFEVNVVDPRNAFVVYSGSVKHKPLLGVVMRILKNGEKHFTCFSKYRRYEINNYWEHAYRSDEKNPLGMISVIEWFRDYDRMGCFERQISEMDNLNLMISDFSNDVEHNTMAVWHTNDVEFPTREVVNEDGTKTEEIIKPKSNDWMQTFTSQDGKTPFIKPLAIDYDYAGMLQNIVTRRALILQKCNIPSRNDNSGGSTGIAMSDATGWSAAETSASKQQNIMESCKMEEVKAVLRAIKASPDVPTDSPLQKLKYTDVQPNIKRQKTYELTVKVNAMCALLAKGFALEDAVTIAPLFEDPNQTIVRSSDGVKKYQEANVFKVEAQTQTETEESRPFPDTSDQEGNSPNIGGMETNNEVSST